MPRVTDSRAKVRYSLHLHSPFRDGMGWIEDLANLNHRLERVRLTDEGSDILTLVVYAEGREDVRKLSRMFHTRIASDLRMEIDRFRVWRGLLKDMTFWAGRSARFKSLDNLCNDVIVEHGTGDAASTATAFSDDSVRYFGRKQCLITADELDAADAQAYADYVLKWRHWPRSEPRAYGGQRAQLRMNFVGYSYILTWLYGTLATAGLSTQDALKLAIDTFGQGILRYTGNSIQDNGQTVATSFDANGRRIVDLLAGRLDTSGRLWRLHIDNGQTHGDQLTVRYEPIDLTPRYFLRHGDAPSAFDTYEHISGSHAVKPWRAEPGYVRRDTTFPVVQINEDPYYGFDTQTGIFQSEQDEYIEAVAFDEYGNASFEPRALTYGQLLSQYGASV